MVLIAPWMASKLVTGAVPWFEYRYLCSPSARTVLIPINAPGLTEVFQE
jgi:hypothetical protein